MVSHVPNSTSLLGMLFGVVFAPIIVLGALFLIVKAALGV